MYPKGSYVEPLVPGMVMLKEVRPLEVEFVRHSRVIGGSPSQRVEEGTLGPWLILRGQLL